MASDQEAHYLRCVLMLTSKPQTLPPSLRHHAPMTSEATWSQEPCTTHAPVTMTAVHISQLLLRSSQTRTQKDKNVVFSSLRSGYCCTIPQESHSAISARLASSLSTSIAFAGLDSRKYRGLNFSQERRRTGVKISRGTHACFLTHVSPKDDST